jgi:hypothetical protein
MRLKRKTFKRLKTATEKEEEANKRARAKIYLKDPLATKETGLLYDFVVIDGDTSINMGPTSGRFIVVDYDPAADRIEMPVRCKEKIVDWTRKKREVLVEFEARRGTPQEAQINAWATAVDTLDFFQEPMLLGRDISWSFEGSRLRILPHAFYEANAFYSRDTRALHFGYFHDKSGNIIKTSLSHDIVAHETSHAILDGMRPFYMSAVDPDTLAFHEYIGDLGAMLSLFHNREGLAKLNRTVSGAGSFFKLISDLAPEVGEGLYGHADRSFLRSANNQLKYEDVQDDYEIHRRSQVLSGFAFELLTAIYQIDLARKFQNGAVPTNKDVLILISDAAKVVGQMLLTPLEFLPPGSISFKEYAAIVLQLDERDYPDDKYEYRKAAVRIMKKRQIYSEWMARRGRFLRYTLRKMEQGLAERKINMIRNSRVGAYRFLNANRSAFEIPKNCDFRVVGVDTNHRETGLKHLLAPETVIQYVWSERIKIPGRRTPSNLDEVIFPMGGIVVVDDNVNLRYWVHQEMTQSRLQLYQDRLRALILDRGIELDPTRWLRSGRPFIVDPMKNGQVQLRLNTAFMHANRGK